MPCSAAFLAASRRPSAPATRALLEITGALAGFAALHGSLLIAGASLRIAKIALQALGVEAPAAATGIALLSGAVGRLSGILAAAGKYGLAGLVAHEALGMVDPNDSAGAWIDKHVPGASWLDNLASHVGLGRSYAEQKQGGQATSDSAAKPTGTAGNPVHITTAKPLPVTGDVHVANTGALASGIDQHLARKAQAPSVGGATVDPRTVPYYGGGF